MDSTLDIVEIFFSIQGESTWAGWPCAFVRLAGCNLRCTWCDTQYAWQRGSSQRAGRLSVDEIVHRLGEMPTRRVEITGGEPLCQPASTELMARLCDAGWQVLLETNGTVDTAPVDPRVHVVLDVKCPSSGQSDRNLPANLDRLGEGDEVKFVIADRDDFRFARDTVRRHDLTARCPVTFSPLADRADLPASLADWILAGGLDVRLGVQLHKVVWPGVDRGV